MPSQKNLTPGYNLQQAQRDIAQLRGASARSGVVLPSGYAGFRVITMPADYTTYTVTAGAVTQCTKSWQIPVNDAQAGTQYRMTVFGTGTQGSVQRALVFQTLGGNFAQCTLPSTFVGTSASFGWRMVVEVTVISTGSSGTANYSISGSGGGANAAATAINGFSVAQAFNTTAAFSLGLGSWWNPNTSSPTMTTDVSMLERLGP
jgi:hypothetical protein